MLGMLRAVALAITATLQTNPLRTTVGMLRAVALAITADQPSCLRQQGMLRAAALAITAKYS